MTANDTTDHAWTREHVATYLAGGLAGDERARFEGHIGACGPCLEDLQDAQATEKSLASAFAGDRPSPWLEDRIIRKLRTAPRPRFKLPTRVIRIAASVAAVFLIAVVGFYAEGLLSGRSNEPGRAMYGFGSVAGAPSPAPPRNEEVVGKFLFANGQSSNLVMGGQEGREKGADYLYGVTQDGLKVQKSELPSAGELAKYKQAELDKLAAGHNTMARNMEVRAAQIKDAERSAFRAAALKPESPGEARKVPDAAMDADRRRASEESAESGEDLGKGRLQGDWYFKPGAEAAKSGGAEVTKKSAADKEKEAWKAQDKGGGKTAGPAQDPQAPSRKIIRQGEMEFEVDSFDSSVETVARIAQEEKGYVATVNSDRLPNGKVKGTIVLRVPPESLDRLVMKLRGLGDLKSQRITSEDITKKYTDLEGHLRAARAMEARLIEIIKSGKGEIKDILAAEKELGTWREKIELYEGELRFYSNLVSLSTLTLTLAEKDIRAPSLVSVTETVDTGIESEDVLKADKDLRALIADAKGRITASDLKKLAAEQFSLLIACEVPPENAGRLRDSLHQLGRITRLDVQTQTSDDGRGRPVDGKVKRNDTVFRISVYNTTNVQPRETAHLNLASSNVEETFRKILARVGKAAGRVVQSNLNGAKGEQVGGVIQFDVPSDQGEAVLGDLRTFGELMSLKVTENPDSANVTKSKKGFYVNLMALSTVGARETATVGFAARDVVGAYRKMQDFVATKGRRVLDARLNEASRDQVTATLDVEVNREDRSAFEDLLKGEGEILTQSSTRAPDDGRVVDSKIRYVLTLQTIASVGPRRLVRIGVEVSDVDAVADRISRIVAEGGGQIVDSQNSRAPNGRAVSFLAFEAPVEKLAGLVDQIRKSGVVRMEETKRNPAAPETSLSIGRVDLTLSNEDPIVGRDAGIGAQLKDGLRSVMAAAGWSLKLILIGALIVVPWALFFWAGWKLVRRMRAKPATAV